MENSSSNYSDPSGRLRIDPPISSLQQNRSPRGFFLIRSRRTQAERDKVSSPPRSQRLSSQAMPATPVIAKQKKFGDGSGERSFYCNDSGDSPLHLIPLNGYAAKEPDINLMQKNYTYNQSHIFIKKKKNLLASYCFNFDFEEQSKILSRD